MKRPDDTAARGLPGRWSRRRGHVGRARLLAAGLLLAGLASPLQAAVDCKASSAPPAMSESVFRIVETAAEEIADGNAARASQRLEGIAGRVRGYERAVVLQALGYARAQSGDHKGALSAFSEALALEALPPQPQQQLQFNTGQLQIAEGDRAAGIRILEAYLREACEPPPAQAHVLLAAAYAEDKRYREALTQIRSAMDKQSPPPEEWLRFRLGLHFELRQYGEAAELLTRLLEGAPRNETYWRQLIGLYFEDGDRLRAVAANALARRLDLLDDARSLRNLATLYQALDIPWKGARVLAQALEDGRLPVTAENLERLANAWMSAREWAEAETALARAAEQADSAKLYARLGQVRVERQRWSEAADAFRAALARRPDNPGRLQYQLGIAAWRAGDADAARRALQAARSDSRSRAAAQQWLDYIDAQRG